MPKVENYGMTLKKVQTGGGLRIGLTNRDLYLLTTAACWAAAMDNQELNWSNQTEANREMINNYAM